MAFSFFDHTGDIGVRLTAPTLAELFQSAVEAFAEAVTDPSSIDPTASVEVALSAAALDLLLADWLREVLNEFETHQLLARTASAEIAGSDTQGFRLTGVLRGERFDAARHGIKVLIKAVTYHNLEVRRTPDGWSATVIFDI